MQEKRVLQSPVLAHEYEFITNGVKDEYLSKELTRYMNMTDEELEKEEKNKLTPILQTHETR